MNWKLFTGRTRTAILKLRKSIGYALVNAGAITLGCAVMPKIQGGVGTDWAGVWMVGGGYTLSSSLYNFKDPLYIRFTGTTVFWKWLITLGGLTPIIGKTNANPTVEIAVADNIALPNLCVDPPVSTTLTLAPSTGTSRTATAYCVGDDYGEVGPEKEFARVIKFVCSTVFA